jgi:HAD superfamily hydrolase (TIGR01450 family)
VRSLADYDAYLFDVDGTLLTPGGALPGVPEALAALRSAGKAIRCVTNNSALTRPAVAARFQSFGLPVEPAEVFSALAATVQMIRTEKPRARVHVFGSDGLREELSVGGLIVTDDEDADYVVAGYNPSVDLEGIGRAMRSVMAGARLIGINRDRRYMGRDELVPGAGVFVAALEVATGQSATIIGKPSPTIVREAVASVGCGAEACLFIGDNLESDIAAARAVGIDGLLVMTGVASPEELATSPIRPTHVLPSVADLRALIAA